MTMRKNHDDVGEWRTRMDGKTTTRVHQVVTGLPVTMATRDCCTHCLTNYWEGVEDRKGATGSAPKRMTH